LNLFGGAKTTSITRTGSKISTLPVQDTTKEARRISSYTAASETSTHDFSETQTTTRRFPANGFFVEGPYHSDEGSTPSEGMFVPLSRFLISQMCSV
jgi:hypothetical protein